MRSVECIQLPIAAKDGHQIANPFAPSPSDPPVPTSDFWLVLRVGTHEVALAPGNQLLPSSDSKGVITYEMPSTEIPNASLRLNIQPAASSEELENLQEFEGMLQQYRSLAPNATALANAVAPPPASQNEDLRGRVVLVNEDNGEIVGELDERLNFEEDKRVAGDDKDRPVVLDFGHVIEGYDHSVKVQRIGEEDMDDWLLKSAHYLR